MRTSRRSLITRTVAGLTVAGLTVTGPAAVAANPQAASSSKWLGGQLSSGLIESEYYDDQAEAWQSYTDFGLSLDIFFAFDQLDVRAGQQAKILEAIEPRVEEYTVSFGTTYAGAVGKILSAVQTEGIDPSTYGEGDLVSQLEDLVIDEGPEEGRGQDSPDSEWESSNSFGQSYVVTALTEADSPEAEAATRFLLQQQCSAGFFREAMGSSTYTCDGGSDDESRPDVDATASVAVALRSIVADLPQPLQDDVRTAAREATRWLVSQQNRNGTFADAANTNSTGLGATALAVAGRNAPATKAARWVNKFRVTPRLARRTALRKADIGAVAFSGADLNKAKRKGITRGDRYVWRRSTAQAAPALDAL